MSRGHGASPSERSNARLSVALRDRPGDAYGLQRADIARVLPVALSCVASSLAEPRRRIRECLTPRVYVASTLSRTLRSSSARPRSTNKPCSYSFLTQGKIACENILRAIICTAVRTGATHFVSILCTQAYRLYFPRTLGNSILGWRRRSK